jgi:hypothetical protein
MATKLAWKALEYEHRPKSVDWFWILGTLCVLGAALSIYFGNFLFGVLILIGGLALGLHANIPPTLHSYSIENDGLIKESTLYPFTNIKKFWFTKDNTGAILLLEINRTLMPIVSIPLGDADKEWIKQVFRAKGIKESELEIPLAERLMDVFGF